jgi:hypothetical protein
MSSTTPQPRLYVLLARAAPRAVIFRRGPSKSVLMIAWDTEHDTFTEGQWLRGRLYERRCDLSPGGSLLVYFAAKYKRHISRLDHPDSFPTWTAVSRPPYFTALTLWPHGDAWNGGGLFADERTLLLNHGSRVPPCAAGFKPPPPSVLAVQPLGGPRGEDDTVQHPRLLRDGWRMVDLGRTTHTPDGDPRFVIDPPRTYVRPSPRGKLLLHRIVHGLGRVNGPWYDEELVLEDPGRRRRTTIEGAEWADWDRGGDLLFAREGKLYRLRAREITGGPERAVLLADFGPRVFASCKPPPTATRWRG